jgi:hypothetical protein
MLAAIDAYFSASDGTEEEVAENLLLDVRDEINKQYRKAVQDAIVGGTGITKGGERIDPASIYAEPKIGCVNHDCDKCKAQSTPVQEPDYWLGYGLQAYTEKPFEDATPVWTSPPAAQPSPIHQGYVPISDDLESVFIEGCGEIPLAWTPTRPAVQEGRDWSLLEATQESLREHMAEIKRLKAAQPAPVQEPVANPVIAGALFDFMGWLTSRKKTLILSSADNASPAVEAITEFAKMRGLSLDGARVQDWQDLTLPTPQPVPVKTYHDGKPWPVAPKPWVGLTEDEMWELHGKHPTLPEYTRAAEAKLKEKNHG